MGVSHLPQGAGLHRRHAGVQPDGDERAPNPHTHPAQAMLDLPSASWGRWEHLPRGCLCCLPSPRMMYLLGTGTTVLAPAPAPALSFPVPLSILPGPSQRCKTDPAGVSPLQCRGSLWQEQWSSSLWLWLGEGDVGKPRHGNTPGCWGCSWRVAEDFSGENDNPAKIIYCAAVKVGWVLCLFSGGLFCFLPQLFTSSVPVFAPLFLSRLAVLRD